MRGALAVAFVALATIPPATAALDARLSASSRSPHVGHPVQIVLRPFWPFTKPDGSCCRLVAAKVGSPIFRLQALGPGERVIMFKPKRDRDPYRWVARFMFTAAGRWEIRVANFNYTTSCERHNSCHYRGPRLCVRARR